jgi:hypothetical protein
VFQRVNYRALTRPLFINVSGFLFAFFSDVVNVARMIANNNERSRKVEKLSEKGSGSSSALDQHLYHDCGCNRAIRVAGGIQDEYSLLGASREGGLVAQAGRE